MLYTIKDIMMATLSPAVTVKNNVFASKTLVGIQRKYVSIPTTFNVSNYQLNGDYYE